MQPILIISFRDLSEPAFFTKAQLIVTSITDNEYYPLPWAENTVPPVRLAAQFATYSTTYGAAKGGDKGNIALRKVARKTLVASFKTNASYLQLVADGSVAKLQTTGYDLRRDFNVRTTPDLLPAPEGFTCVRGPLSGTVIIGCAALHGAGGYKSQLNFGDPTVEAGWVDSRFFKNCDHNTIPDLPVGKVVSVRLCGIGASRLGLYTDPISLMIV